MKTFIATIRLRFPFPLDMLRYDACHPATERDSQVIEQSLRQSMFHDVPEVKVARFAEKGTTAARAFTVERWKSFGAEVIKVEEVRT